MPGDSPTAGTCFTSTARRRALTESVTSRTSTLEAQAADLGTCVRITRDEESPSVALVFRRGGHAHHLHSLQYHDLEIGEHLKVEPILVLKGGPFEIGLFVLRALDADRRQCFAHRAARFPFRHHVRFVPPADEPVGIRRGYEQDQRENDHPTCRVRQQLARRDAEKKGVARHRRDDVPSLRRAHGQRHHIRGRQHQSGEAGGFITCGKAPIDTVQRQREEAEPGDVYRIQRLEIVGTIRVAEGVAEEEHVLINQLHQLPAQRRPRKPVEG